MKAMAWFGGAVVAIVLVSGLMLAIPFSSSPDRNAIRSSALVALIVQALAFGVAKLLGTRSFLAGWMVGIAIRFGTLVVYGIVAVKVLAMPAPAALISLVTFLFLSTLAETKLLAL
jgi:hypothetical protein